MRRGQLDLKPMVEISTRLSSQLKPIPPASDLAFGRYFTDHWFFAKYAKGKGWFEAAVEPYGKISLDPGASVFHYGQALFEGMKAFGQPDGSISVFRPDFNVERMAHGAERLCLVAPPADLFKSGLKKLLQADARWIPKEPGCSLYIRPTLIGTEAFLGVRPSNEVMFFIMLSPVGNYYSSKSSTLRIWIENKALRAAPGGLGATKAGANYAASLQAALVAKEKGFDQVLWTDVEHKAIEEVGTMNVFFVFKDEIVTPALNGSILAGGMRDSVIQWLKHKKQNVSERKLTVDELLQRQKKGELLEAFGTGTAAVISPVGEFCYNDVCFAVNDRSPGVVSQGLYKDITAIQYGRAPDVFNWMKPAEQL